MFPLLASTFLYGIYKYRSYKFSNKIYLFIYLFTLLLFCLASINTIISISKLGYSFFSVENKFSYSSYTGLSFLFTIFNIIACIKGEYLFFLDYDLHIPGLTNLSGLSSPYLEERGARRSRL